MWQTGKRNVRPSCRSAAYSVEALRQFRVGAKLGTHSVNLLVDVAKESFQYISPFVRAQLR